MGKEEIIEHEGVIVSIDGDKISVKIEQLSGCAGCHANGVCSVADKAEKIIETTKIDNLTYNIGERVIVYGQKNLGLRAVLIAFVIPFIIIIVAVGIASRFTTNEALSGTIGLLSLIPYLIILAVMKNKLRNRFRFYITKYNKSTIL